MAHSPVVLDAYAALEHGLQELGTFDGRTREAVALLVGAVDQCTYCQAAHTLGGRRAGLTEQETIDARRGTSSDPKLQALLTVAEEQITTGVTSATRSGRRRSTPAGRTRSWRRARCS